MAADDPLRSSIRHTGRAELFDLGNAVQWTNAGERLWRRYAECDELSAGAYREQCHGTRVLLQDARPQQHGRGYRQHKSIHEIRCACGCRAGSERVICGGEWNSIGAGKHHRTVEQCCLLAHELIWRGEIPAFSFAISTSI